MTEAEIAAFQAALLKILRDEGDVLSRLEQSLDCVPFADYIDGFEESMIDVAVALVRQWGKRNSLHPESLNSLLQI
jgi:hypothetical protein